MHLGLGISICPMHRKKFDNMCFASKKEILAKIVGLNARVVWAENNSIY